MIDKEYRSSCPVNFALELFGDKWTLLIIRDMLFAQRKDYSGFLNGPESISTNILADRLKQLVSHGLVGKYPDPEDGKKFVYLLTEMGEDLVPVMMEIIRWGIKYAGDSAVPEPFRTRLQQDFDGLAEETRTQVRNNRVAFLSSLAS